MKRRILILILLAFVTTLASTPILSAQICQLQQRKLLFDCDCTTMFLRDRFGEVDAYIMIKLWIYNAAFAENKTKIVNLYRQYGQERINEAVLRFFMGRWSLYRECQYAPIISD